MNKCICKKCPSYLCEEQVAYCFTGKSKCIKKQNGCICQGCLVYKENKFNIVYFCIKGKL